MHVKSSVGQWGRLSIRCGPGIHLSLQVSRSTQGKGEVEKTFPFLVDLSELAHSPHLPAREAGQLGEYMGYTK